MENRFWVARPGQGLLDHLGAVAANAKRFGGDWAGPWAEIAGWWHDFGKFSDDFQTYIGLPDQQRRQRKASNPVNHSSAGAIHAMRRMQAAGLSPEAWEAVSAVIFAHHGKLSDYTRFRERLGIINPEAGIVAEKLYQDALRGGPPDWYLDLLLPPQPSGAWEPLFTRMLFSALVDGDRTDAGGLEARPHPPISELLSRYHAYMDKKMSGAVHDGGGGVINDLRAQALRECLNNSSLPHGVFALDAPTGFGKTLAALGFALEHAHKHGLDRIIYVAPFLNAIEQTAQVFREALDDHDRSLVLEHHSNADRDLKDDKDEEDDKDRYVIRDPEALLEERMQQRENWDARIIVTSNVQFFESLHAHDAGRCRKLHRIAKAVVLIDEPQSLPVTFMAPVAKAMDELSKHYGTSLVLVTATQPAFGWSRKFPHGIKNIRPLISAGLLGQMRHIANARVNVTLPDWTKREAWLDIANRIGGYDHATLTIVNTKKNARDLYRALKDIDVPFLYHLSAGMCVAHRKVVLDAIKAHLQAGDPVKVISTQVVEAGIDIDFPRVMRAMAGLDSLIQSAGRCNRHGLQMAPGEFEVFVPEDEVPLMFRHAEGFARSLLQRGKYIFDAATIDEFYRLMVEEKLTDLRRIIKSQEARNFTQAGRDFRLIDPTTTVVVPYSQGGRDAINRLKSAMTVEKIDDLFDDVQQFCVSVTKGQAEKLAENLFISDLGRFRLWIAEEHAYDEDMGLLGADDVLLSDPSAFII